MMVNAQLDWINAPIIFIKKRRQQQRKTISLLLRDFFFLSFSFASSFVLTLEQVNEIFSSILLSQLYWIFLQVLDHLQVLDNVEPQGEALLSYWVRDLLIPIYIPTSQLSDSIKSCINASMFNKVLNLNV